MYEEIDRARERDCPQCGGSGEVVRTTSGPRGLGNPETEEPFICPNCGGSGEDPAKKGG